MSSLLVSNAGEDKDDRHQNSDDYRHQVGVKTVHLPPCVLACPHSTQLLLHVVNLVMNLLPGVLVLALLQLTAAQLQPEADSPGVVTDWEDPDPVHHNAQTVLLSQPHHDWREGVCVDPPSLSLSHPEPVAPVLDPGGEAQVEGGGGGG